MGSMGSPEAEQAGFVLGPQREAGPPREGHVVEMEDKDAGIRALRALGFYSTRTEEPPGGSELKSE